MISKEKFRKQRDLLESSMDLKSDYLVQAGVDSRGRRYW